MGLGRLAFEVDVAVGTAHVDALGALEAEDEIVRARRAHVEVEGDGQAVLGLEQARIDVAQGVVAFGQRMVGAELLGGVFFRPADLVLTLEIRVNRSPRLMFIHWATGPMGCVG